MKRPSRSECRHGSDAASEVSQMQEAKARAWWPEVLTIGSRIRPTVTVLDESHRSSGIPLAEVENRKCLCLGNNSPRSEF